MDIPQERKLVTEIPGPRSTRVVRPARATPSPRGVAALHPIVTARASGAIVEDVDGNRLIDFATGHRRAQRRPHRPEVVEAIARQAELDTHTLLPRDGERAVHRARRAAQRAHARRPRQEDDVRELRRRGGRERREDRPLPHRAQRDRRRSTTRSTAARCWRCRSPRRSCRTSRAWVRSRPRSTGCRSPTPTGGSAARPEA